MNKQFENRILAALFMLLVSLMLAVTGSATADERGDKLKLHYLQKLDAEFARGEHGYVDKLLVMQDGKVLIDSRYEHDYLSAFDKIDSDPDDAESWGRGRGDYYYVDPNWHPWLKGGELHTMQSVTKSVVSALIGIAILRGEIESLDMLVAPLLGSRTLFGGDSRAKDLALRHILTMTSGIAWNETDYSQVENDGNLLELAPSWKQYVLDKRFRDVPGTVFNYNSGSSLLLDVVLFESTGMHAAEYAKKHLFDPLGIDSFYWKTTPDGLSDTLGGLYLRPEDLALFGMLYANDGVWNGTRLLPKGWVQNSFTPSTSLSSAPDWTGESFPGGMYGYLWWLLPDPDQADKFVPVARGYGGQRLVVLREDGVIAILSGWNIFDGSIEFSDTEFLQRLVEAFR